MPLRAAACLHLHPTHCSQMFDSLQRNIAGTAASTATIGGPVAVAFIAAAGSFLRRSDAWREHPVAAAGRCHAAWSEGGDQRGPDGAPERRPSMGGLACSQARLGRRLRRFAARSMAHRRCHGYGKKCACESSFCGRFRMPERAQACELKA